MVAICYTKGIVIKSYLRTLEEDLERETRVKLSNDKEKVMNKDEKDLTENEDTEVRSDECEKIEADLPTPEKEEDQCESEAKPAQEDPSAFSACVTLKSELISSKSLQEVVSILDYQLQAIRNLAIKKITEIKS